MRWLRSLRETRSAAGHRQPMRIAAIAPCKTKRCQPRQAAQEHIFSLDSDPRSQPLPSGKSSGLEDSTDRRQGPVIIGQPAGNDASTVVNITRRNDRFQGERAGCGPNAANTFPHPAPALKAKTPRLPAGFSTSGWTGIYSTMEATMPAPTVRPPSRIAKRSFSSIAIGTISSTSTVTLSPGITISVPSGSVTMPVTSVVRK
ncbi:hypothetical protein FB005_11057 [Sinorhizobium medicae]|nr:hypothetical protein FB006_110167 [Sinorhizobium medicae]TWA42849.1 hypothetical protein FB005_11057 [Sinorhizobium medicae]TWA51130.1 hypothetical protein FB008_11057 [Sinorhizobium medicae]